MYVSVSFARERRSQRVSQAAGNPARVNAARSWILAEFTALAALRGITAHSFTPRKTYLISVIGTSAKCTT